MAKRYAIAPIIGDGSFGNEFRSAFALVDDTNVKSVIVGDENGIPIFLFALSSIGTANLAGVSAVSNSYIFPDYPLDGQLSGMNASALSGLKQSVEAFDMDGNGRHFSVDISDGSISYRALLISIYQQFDPLLSAASFNTGFDAPEVGQVP